MSSNKKRYYEKTKLNKMFHQKGEIRDIKDFLESEIQTKISEKFSKKTEIWLQFGFAFFLMKTGHPLSY